MGVQVVFVHGVRTSHTMWRAQQEYLTERGTESVAVDLPGHGTRRGEPFTLEESFRTIDDAVQDAASRGPVLLVGHSLGGLLTTEYMGTPTPPPVAGFVAVSCTVVPFGIGILTYRAMAKSLDVFPNHGAWLTERVLAATLPPETRGDFGAGGYAYHAQDTAIRSTGKLTPTVAAKQIRVPTWFVNGQYDQLRLHERRFLRHAPHAELIVVPGATHLVTAMYPEVFNLVLNVAITTLEQN